MKCEQCGAVIDPLVFACPYCHLTTPAGAAASARQAQASQAQQQWQAAVQYQNQQATLMQLRSTANMALGLSIAGVVIFCFPLGIAAIVQAVRARLMAKAQKTEIPTRTTVALALGAVSCVLSISFIVWADLGAAEDQKRADARIAELDKQIGSKAAAPVLDHAVACQLAERNALKVGYSDVSGYSFKTFECVGRLTQTPDNATLEDFQANKFKVSVCFKHGAVWYVGEMREDGCAASVHDDAGPTSVDEPSSATSSAATHHASTAKHDAGANHLRDAH